MAMVIEEGESAFLVDAADDGSGDFLVSVEAKALGFSGHADGHVVGSEWHSFVQQLASLEADRKGVAHLRSAAGEFNIEIKSIDSWGHLAAAGYLSYQQVGDRELFAQKLHFAFEFDPSKIAAFSRAAGDVQQAVATDRGDGRRSG